VSPLKIPPPVAELLGIEVVSAGGGECTMRMEAVEEHSNPMGTVQGGILCALADGAMGFAFVSTLEDGDSFTTVELKMNYLRPFRTGTLLAHGKVVHRGRTVGLTECRVVDENERLIAHSTSTCMVLRGDVADSR
jgi:uncharacterized protein (TIGR00369 family)